MNPLEIDTLRQDLVALNQRIGEMEQKQGTADPITQDEVRSFFTTHLSDQLIFRRASGKIVGKVEENGFMDGLTNPSPFASRESTEISVHLMGERALVTLIVVGTRADDGSVHRYRNIRLFTRSSENWVMELWYNYEITGL